jgi:uncharacterized membrane protein
MSQRKVAQSRWLIALVLLTACAGCLGMLVLRGRVSGSFQMRYLVWNLFLAAVPFPFAWIADGMGRRGVKGPWILWPILLWLLFFPNAPYLVTDLIHLEPTRAIPLWFDGLVFFAFAATGLLLAFASLYLVQAVIARRRGTAAGWVVAAVAISLGAYGIYLGRVERWNSWDVVTNPKSLASSVRNQVADPLSNRQAVVITVGFALFMGAVYGTLRAFAFLVTVDAAERQRLEEETPGDRSGRELLDG